LKIVPYIAAIVSRLNEPPADHAAAMTVAAIAAIIAEDKVTVIGATDETTATQIGSS